MRKTLVSLVPLAVGLAVVGAAISWLLGRDMALGRWLLAAFLLGHGLVHLLFLSPAPAPKSADAPAWPFSMAGSWLVTRLGLSANLVRNVGLVLVLVVVAAFALAALSTAGLVVPATGWPVRIAGAAAASAVLLAIFMNPSLVLGIAIDGVLLWVAIARVWAP